MRFEPKDYKHRYVNMYYFDVYEEFKHIKLWLIKEKIEIKKKAYYIYDIFGLENLKKLKNND